ncbi:hypothetical protein EIP91_006657 [Steccherinum ochraceum]|uniref:BTB domain-containing protein n=1 Tax=Steccherinum ochraceum TaxID=92696 RepID=A0A4R0R818_9APHY|nr:hypothetical protein EIP91_006657 [Steccherinum ochraceum]
MSSGEASSRPLFQRSSQPPSQPPSQLPARSVVITSSAPAPFDVWECGQIVLRSSRGTDFFVYPLFLHVASSVVKRESPILKTSDGIPLITVYELDDNGMEAFLKIIYPFPNPPLVGITQILSVLKVGKDYCIDAVRLHAKEALHTLLGVDGYRVFAYSCIMGMEEEAQAAADVILSNLLWAAPQLHYISDMAMISAGVYHRLLTFLSKDSTVPPDQRFLLTIGDQQLSVVAQAEAHDVNTYLDPATLERHPADVVICSMSKPFRTFPVHKNTLSMASDVLAKKIAGLPQCTLPSLPVLSLPENVDVVQLLLDFSYGVAIFYGLTTGDASGIPLLVKVARAAVAYAMPRLIAALKNVVKHLHVSEPLDAYIMAVECGWEAEARKAALAIISDPKTPKFPYSCSLEAARAKSYHRLLKFRADVQVVVKNVMWISYSPYSFGSSRPAAALPPEQPPRTLYGVEVTKVLTPEKMLELVDAVEAAVGKVGLEFD